MKKQPRTVKRRPPSTCLGIKRRFLAIVRTVDAFRHELNELAPHLKRQSIEEIESPTAELTPETHLLGLMLEFGSALEEACLKVGASRHAWSGEDRSQLEAVVIIYIRECAKARACEILLEIAQGLGVVWRQDLEFEIWHALTSGTTGAGALDISNQAVELQELTAILKDRWWRWNSEEEELELVWTDHWTWKKPYAEWVSRATLGAGSGGGDADRVSGSESRPASLSVSGKH